MKELKQTRHLRRRYKTIEFIKPRSLCDAALFATRRALNDCEVRGWIAEELEINYPAFCRMLNNNSFSREIVDQWGKLWKVKSCYIEKMLSYDPDAPSLIVTRLSQDDEPSTKLISDLLTCSEIVNRNLNQSINDQRIAVKQYYDQATSELAYLSPSLYHLSSVLIDTRLDEYQCECRINSEILYNLATWGGFQLKAELEYWQSSVATVFRGVSYGAYDKKSIPVDFTKLTMTPAIFPAREILMLDKIKFIVNIV